MFNLFKKSQPEPAPAAASQVEKPKTLLDHAVTLGAYARYPDTKAYQEAFVAALNFGDREAYLAWVAEWKHLYKYLTADARNWYKKDPVNFPVKYGRATRHAMMVLRMAGKAKSWAMKGARLAAST